MASEAPRPTAHRPRPSDARTRAAANSAAGGLMSKPPCQIHAKAVVSEKAIITGSRPVTIGANTVIHPYARLDSSQCAVDIADGCVIAERTLIGLVDQTNGLPAGYTSISIESSVSIEAGSVIEAQRICKGSVVEANAIVGNGATIGKFCKISAGCSIGPGEIVPDYTVIYGSNQKRHDTTTEIRADIRELKLKGHAMHVDALRRLIPSNIVKWQT